MTARVSISSNRITMDEVWAYYETVRAAIVRGAESAKRSLAEGIAPQDSRLFGMSIDELDEHFERSLDEADTQVCLFLIAAAEGTIRVDFIERVYKRGRDAVSRAFRDIYKSRRDHSKVKVRLGEDILDTWASEIPGARPHISMFKGALRFRDWLAHGRYWVPKLGQKYDPSVIVQIITSLFGAIGLVDN